MSFMCDMMWHLHVYFYGLFFKYIYFQWGWMNQTFALRGLNLISLYMWNDNKDVTMTLNLSNVLLCLKTKLKFTASQQVQIIRQCSDVEKRFFSIASIASCSKHNHGENTCVLIHFTCGSTAVWCTDAVYEFPQQHVSNLDIVSQYALKCFIQRTEKNNSTISNNSQSQGECNQWQTLSAAVTCTWILWLYPICHQTQAYYFTLN